MTEENNSQREFWNKIIEKDRDEIRRIYAEIKTIYAEKRILGKQKEYYKFSLNLIGRDLMFASRHINVNEDYESLQVLRKRVYF